MHSHFTMTFPSFLFTTLTHPSHPRHTLLSFTTTSLDFTVFSDDFSHTLLTFHLKLLDLEERVPKASVGSWFQSCLLLSAPNFPIMIDPAQIAWYM
jgi:hypothetical protein